MMPPKIKLPSAALFGVLCGLMMMVAVNSADACNRAGCGLFGRHCRFQQVHHRPTHHVVHQQHYQPPQVVIQNSIYPQQLAATGSSDYGLSLQSYRGDQRLDIAANVNGLLRLSQSVIDGGNNLALRVTDTVRETSATAMALQQSSGAQAAEVAKLMQLVEIARATKGEPIVQEVRIEADGQLNIADAATDEPPQAKMASLATNCAKCHSGPAPKGGLLLDSAESFALLSCEMRIKAQQKVKSGAMPPPGKGEPLSEQQKLQLIAELAGSD